MQDNKWQDDEAFYDEAWADMNQRLNAQRKSPWPWAWLLLIIPVLLVGIAFSTGVFHEKTEVARTQVKSEGPDEADFQTALRSNEAVSNNQISTTLSEKTGTEGQHTQQLQRLADYLEKSDQKPLIQPSISVKEGGPTPRQPGGNPQLTLQSSSRQSRAPLIHPANTSVEMPPPPHPAAQEVGSDWASRDLAAAIRPLHPLEPAPLVSRSKAIAYPHIQVVQPEVVATTNDKKFTKSDKPYSLRGWALSSSLALDGEWQEVSTGLTVGYGIGLGNKFVLTPALGYQWEGRTIETFTGAYGPEENLTTITAEDLVTVSNLYAYQVTFSEVQLDAVRYGAVTGSLGLSCQPARRWFLQARLELQYLTYVEGPSLVTGSGQEWISTSFADVNQDYYAIPDLASVDLSVDVFRNYQVPRFQSVGSLSIGYHLGGPWSVSLKGRHLLSQFSQEKGLNVDRKQLGLGLRYSLF